MKKLLLVLMAVFALTANAQEEKKVKPSWLNSLAEHFHFNGYAMADWQYHDKSTPNNEFSVEKIIFIADAKLNDKFSAEFMYDFRKTSLHELWVNYRPCDAVNIKIGQFKTPFSIENPIAPVILETINLTSLVTTDMIMGSNPLMMPAGAGRDIGITVYGDLFDKKLSYDLAVMNGGGRNNKDINSQKDFVARLSFKPIKELMLSGSMVLGTGNVAVTKAEDGSWISPAAPGVTGFKANGNYTRNRFAAGLQLKTKPANLRAEYMWGKDGNFNSNGYYATGSLNNILVKKLDLIASYDHLKNFQGKQDRYTAGLQYWFYKACRVQLNYTHHKRGEAEGENSILTQVQVAF